MKKVYLILNLIIFFFGFSAFAFACDQGDNACFQDEFNNNPTPANFQNLDSPTLNDFDKLPDPKSISNFNKLNGNQKENFFLKDKNNINGENKDLFKSYLSNDLGVNVVGIDGPIKNFDGVSLEGTNQRVDLLAIKDGNYGIKVQEDGKITLVKGEGKINFEGNVKSGNNGDLIMYLDKGSDFKSEGVDFSNSNLKLNIIGPSNIDLGNGFSFKVKQGNFDFEIKEFDSYNFIKDDSPEKMKKIYFDSKNKNIAANGCCVVLNYNDEKVEVGNDNKIGFATLSEKEINVAGFTKFRLGKEVFETDNKNFFKNIISDKNNIANQKLTNIDKSVTFFSKDDQGDIMNIELNIGKKRNEIDFTNDVNSLLDGFVEKIKTDDMFKDFREYSVAEFFKKNKQMLGFSGPIKSMTTIVHEYVTNAIDAAEAAGILPDITVKIVKEEAGSGYEIMIEDNGSGMPVKVAGKALGQLLAGTKFEQLSQSRGQQGIGAAYCTLFSQITTGKPTHVKTGIGDGKVTELRLTIDVKNNKPKIESKKEYAK